MDRANEILRYWFGDLGDGSILPKPSELWFSAKPETDKEIRIQFGDLWKEASEGKLKDWETNLYSRLALIVLLDQFSRNLFRGKPQAFSQDTKALALALRTIQNAEDKRFRPLERVFVYLPLEHAEDLPIQQQALRCFKELVSEAPPLLKNYFSENLRYAERHLEIIQRFGRFPHRNAILGRQTTTEEAEFLKEPMSSF